MEEERTCASCRFAKPTAYPLGTVDVPDVELLECYRFPPTSVTSQSGPRPTHPRVRADDWCGEFQLPLWMTS